MFYYCLECGEIYRSDTPMKKCPKNSCQALYDLAEIDEMMLPVIEILNQKGYRTGYCCSGHYKDFVVQQYILFESFVNLEDFVNKPDMFYMYTEKDFGRVILELKQEYIDGINKVQQIVNIHKSIIQLIEWADSLPNIKD